MARYSLRMLMAKSRRIRHIPSKAQLRIAADFWYGSVGAICRSRNESMLNERREREHQQSMYLQSHSWVVRCADAVSPHCYAGKRCRLEAAAEEVVVAEE